jgi:Uma2 family endonuclease
VTVDTSGNEKMTRDYARSVGVHRFTVADYRRMVEAGILREDALVELIRGQVVDLGRVSAPRLGMINRFGRLLPALLKVRGTLSIHNPVQLDDISEPRPDIAILRFRADDYASALPVADEVLMIIKVFYTMLEEHRSINPSLYAESGIPECWLVNLSERPVQVYREPVGSRYNQAYLVGYDGVLDFVAFPDSSILAEVLWR